MSMQNKAQMVEAVLFFDERGICKEMLFPEFEALLMTRPEVQRDERWAWLWDPRSPGGVWYRWRLWTILTGASTERGSGHQRGRVIQSRPGPCPVAGDDHRAAMDLPRDPEKSRPVTVHRDAPGEIGFAHGHQGVSWKGVPDSSSRSALAIFSDLLQSRRTPSHSTTLLARYTVE